MSIDCEDVIKPLEDYLKKKSLISEEIKKDRNTPGTLSLNKATSNLFRERSISDKKLDARSFNQIIQVDPENHILDVEGMAPYEEIVHETLKFGCLPAVVPQLKSITVGGAISGCGIEASSFKYGLVHESVLEMEILLSNGDVILCTPENEHKDLFYAFPNSYGTLGYVLRVKMLLICAEKYIKITHRHYQDPVLYFNEIKRLCLESREIGSPMYIDGVIFNETDLVITTGEFIKHVPYLSNYKYLDIYYQSLQHKQIDYLTTLDYIWRWDPDWFWCSKVFFMQNKVIRLLLGKWMLHSAVYSKIMHFFNRHPKLSKVYTNLQKKRESIIQDVLIPIEEAHGFLEFFQNEINIKPIWICPTMSYLRNSNYDFCPINPSKLYVDFGFWDSIGTNQEEGFFNRKIEKNVTQLGGFKSLYSSSFYTQDEFWSIYNSQLYFRVKQKYDSLNAFKDLYSKCVTTSR